MSDGVAGGGQEISAAALAAQIKGFVKDLPAIDTVRDAIRRELQDKLRIARERRKAEPVAKAPERPQVVAKPVDRGQDNGPDR